MGYNVVWLLSWILMCFVFGNFKNGVEGHKLATPTVAASLSSSSTCCVCHFHPCDDRWQKTFQEAIGEGEVTEVTVQEGFLPPSWGREGGRNEEVGRSGSREWAGRPMSYKTSRSPMTPFFQEVPTPKGSPAFQTVPSSGAQCSWAMKDILQSNTSICCNLAALVDFSRLNFFSVKWKTLCHIVRPGTLKNLEKTQGRYPKIYAMARNF